ncbi:MAG: hypothetical protein QXW70_02495 [Candidatus Anstonellales archaeon]
MLEPHFLIKIIRSHYIIALYLLFTLLWLPFFTLPFSHDESVFIFIGRGITQGQVLYKDLFDNKGPFLYLVYAALWGLFGLSEVYYRVVFYFFVIISAILLRKISKELFPSLNPRITEISYLLLMSIPTSIPFAISETLVNLLIISAATLILEYKKRQSSLYLVASGFLFSLCILTNFLSVFSLPFVLWLLLEVSKANQKEKSLYGTSPHTLTIFFLSAIIPHLIFSFYLLTSQSLAAFMEVISVFAPAFYIKFANLPYLLIFLTFFLPFIRQNERNAVACAFSLTLSYIPSLNVTPTLTSHYSIFYFPFLSLLIPLTYKNFKILHPTIQVLVIMYLLNIYLNPFIDNNLKVSYLYDNDAYSKERTLAYKELYSNFSKNISGKDIAVFSYDISPYLYLNSTPKIRYPYFIYLFSYTKINYTIEAEYSKRMSESPFEYIIIGQDLYGVSEVPQSVMEHLKNNYTLLYSKEFSPERLSHLGSSKLLLYKRN